MSGYKTYIIAACTVAFGILGLITGNLDSTAAMGFITGGLGAAALRHGISTTASSS